MRADRPASRPYALRLISPLIPFGRLSRVRSAPSYPLPAVSSRSSLFPNSCTSRLASRSLAPPPACRLAVDAPPRCLPRARPSAGIALGLCVAACGGQEISRPRPRRWSERSPCRRRAGSSRRACRRRKGRSSPPPAAEDATRSPLPGRTATVGPNLDDAKPTLRARADADHQRRVVDAGVQGHADDQQIADVVAFVVESTGGTVPAASSGGARRPSPPLRPPRRPRRPQRPRLPRPPRRRPRARATRSRQGGLRLRRAAAAATRSPTPARPGTSARTSTTRRPRTTRRWNGSRTASRPCRRSRGSSPSSRSPTSPPTSPAADPPPRLPARRRGARVRLRPHARLGGSRAAAADAARDRRRACGGIHFIVVTGRMWRSVRPYATRRGSRSPSSATRGRS